MRNSSEQVTLSRDTSDKVPERSRPLTSRERLIAEGFLRPARPMVPGSPSPQRWRDEPTVRLSPAERARFEFDARNPPRPERLAS